jgi:hypothetical protein
VAVLDRKLLALDRPAALRGRLTTGRVIVRLASDAGAYVAAARSLAPDATADDSTLILTLGRPERDTPELVRALVRAGADVLEVRPEIPALEDVYLHLLGGG